MDLDLGLLVIRVVVGLLFVGHGLQKLSGLFGGHGVDGTAGFFGQLGYPAPKLAAIAAGLGETLGGLLFALGLLTPLAAAALVGVMVNAIIVVHRPNGIWVTANGYEYNLTLVAAAAGVALAGPGGWALDAALGWDTVGLGWRLGALAIGAVAGVAVAASALAGARTGEGAQATAAVH
jgi:putative oxidoreductase